MQALNIHPGRHHESGHNTVKHIQMWCTVCKCDNIWWPCVHLMILDREPLSELKQNETCCSQSGFGQLSILPLLRCQSDCWHVSSAAIVKPLILARVDNECCGTICECRHLLSQLLESVGLWTIVAIPGSPKPWFGNLSSRPGCAEAN